VVINKEEMVKAFLSKKGVQSSEIAIWLSDKKENKELIEKNESEVVF